MSKLKKWMEERTSFPEGDRRDEGTDPGIRLFGHVIALPGEEEMNSERLNSEEDVCAEMVDQSDGDSLGGVTAGADAPLGGCHVATYEVAVMSAGRPSGLDAVVAAALPSDEDGSGSGGDEFGSSSGSNSGSDVGVNALKEGVGNNTESPREIGPNFHGARQASGGWDGEGSGSEGSASEGGPAAGGKASTGMKGLARALSSEQQAAADAAWEFQQKEQDRQSERMEASPAGEHFVQPAQQQEQEQEQEKQTEQKQQKGEQGALKKPDKIVPCPRCNSMDTKFCYYNNYNVNQPRHFCKKCQRYWTAGGTLRNVPVGSGRRKSKHALQRSAESNATSAALLAGYRGDKLDTAQLLGSALAPPELDMQLGLAPMDPSLGMPADMRLRVQQAAFRRRLGSMGSGSGSGFDSTGCGDSGVTGVASSLRRDASSGEDLVSSGHLQPIGSTLGLQLEPSDSTFCRDSSMESDSRMRRMAVLSRKGSFMESLTGGAEEGSHLGMLLRDDPGSSTTALASEARDPMGSLPMVHHPSPTAMYATPAMADSPLNPWASMSPAGSAMGPHWSPAATHYGYFGNGAWTYGYGMGWTGPTPTAATPASAAGAWHSPAGVWTGGPPWASAPGPQWGPQSQWMGPWGSMQWTPATSAVAASLPVNVSLPAGSALGKRMRTEGLEGEARDGSRTDSVLWGPKALRIEDPGEGLTRNSAWTRVGLNGVSPSEAARSSTVLRPYPSKEINKAVDLRHMNPAAMARSMVFHES